MAFTRPIGPGSHFPRAPRRNSGWLPVESEPDLQSQLEELLSHVRRCEKWARFDDRLDLLGRQSGDH
jgi:hypothetical protein